MIPGLKERYAQQADGGVLVHGGSYTPKRSTTTTFLHESMPTFNDPHTSLTREKVLMIVQMTIVHHQMTTLTTTATIKNYAENVVYEEYEGEA